MASTFSARNLIYWWMLITSFIFLQRPTRDFAQSLRDSKIFSTGSPPFNIAEGLTKTIDSAVIQIVRAVQFDPNVVVIKVGNTLILDGFRVGFLLILLLLILAIRFYLRAVASPAIYDDIVALVMCFFVYHLIAQTLRFIKFPAFGNAPAGTTFGDQMINERSAWVWFLAIVILGMVLGGKGWKDSKVFWKGIIELFFVWLFFIPQAAAASFAQLLTGLADLGATLQTNSLWSVVWAAIGLLVAVTRLYNVPVAPKPAKAAKPAPGSGGGAAKNADGIGGLIRLTRK